MDQLYHFYLDGVPARVLIAVGLLSLVLFAVQYTTINAVHTRKALSKRPTSECTFQVKRCKVQTQRTRYGKLFITLVVGIGLIWLTNYIDDHYNYAYYEGLPLARHEAPFTGWLLSACMFAPWAVVAASVALTFRVASTPAMFRGRTIFGRHAGPGRYLLVNLNHWYFTDCPLDVSHQKSQS